MRLIKRLSKKILLGRKHVIGVLLFYFHTLLMCKSRTLKSKSKVSFLVAVS